MKGHTDYINSIAFSPDGAQLATASSDSTARLWDARTGAELRRLEGHTHNINSIAFSPDGALLATGSWDSTARLWDVRKGAKLQAPARSA